MKKSTKRIVSMMLAASMMFTTVAANPSFAFAADDVVAYEAFTGTTVLDMKDVHAAFAAQGFEDTIGGDVLGAGISVVLPESASPNAFKGAWNAKEGTAAVFSDGTSCAEKYQMGKGNNGIAADAAVGTVVAAPEKALMLEAGGAGTVTIYADAGSSSATDYVIALLDSNYTVLQSAAKVRGTLEPTALTIPAAGTYYILVPGNTTSLNIGVIKVDLAEGGVVETTEETTEATTEETTEATTEETTVETTEATTEETTVETTEATTEETTVETTEETTVETTEATTAPVYAEDTILVQPIAPVAVAQDGKNVVDKDTNPTFDVNIDLKNVANFAASNNGNGINNYTFFITYDPTVVKMTDVATLADASQYVTYEMEDDDGNPTNKRIYDRNKIRANIKMAPPAEDPDYTDVGADGVKTSAELGKVKFANYIGDSNEDSTLKTANNDGVLVALTFEVVGTGDTKIAVDLAGRSSENAGIKSNPTSTKHPVSVALAGNIFVGEVVETTTESTETTTEETTVETTEATTEETTVETTEATTEATTAPETESETASEETTLTEATTVETTEATTVAPTVESTTEATTAKAEETTRKHSSNGGGGGGSSSHKASNDNPDKKTDTSGTKEDNNKGDDTKPSTPSNKPSFTITNKDGKDVVIAPPVNDSKRVSFTDISSRPWATDAINKLAKLGIVNGVSESNFAPDAYSKRADFVIMIVNTLGITGTATSNFDDVYAGKYYFNAVGLGYEAGIVEGYGDGTFGPEKYCTREEMMVLVAQTFKFLGEDITASESVLSKYADNASISWWAKPYVAYLTEAGIATGTGANLEPSVYITRAQMAVMIDKVYDKVVDMAEEAMAAAEAEAAAEETTEETTEEVSEEETSEDESSEETTVEEETAEETTEAE